MKQSYYVLNFYHFTPLGGQTELLELKERLKNSLVENRVFGTIIIAGEGFNASVCGEPAAAESFVKTMEGIVGLPIEPKISICTRCPFRKQEVRIKPEIVTFRQTVDLALGKGTHISPEDWDEIISDPEVLLLDTRNDYEYRSGTFVNAINPETQRFSELASFADASLDPAAHKKVAMFCTGGIRCEKFAPYLKAIGFETVYQLRGGILKYLEETGNRNGLWQGECFVFDERITLDSSLEKGDGPDLSQRHVNSEG
ncbi:MAG TPA: rhodanese-like domain-containing protein [Pyrinomonadaceae bacterium]|nr:rhodanese-like domain-containing protein [Pyrinomonadaceae bacterium]